MRMRSVRTVATAVSLIALLSAAVVAGAAEPVKLKVGVHPYLRYAPFFIAMEEGIFAREGIEIEVVRLERQAEMVAALVSGEVDVAAGGINAGFLNAMARGAPIRYVADMGYIGRSASGCSSCGIIVSAALAKEGPLTAERLKGRKVGSIGPQATSWGFFVRNLLAPGGSIAEVDFEVVPETAQGEALERGLIDMAMSSDPWLTRLRESGQGVLWKGYEEATPGGQGAGIVFGSRMFKGDREPGARFLRAYLAAVSRYQEGKTPGNLDIIARGSGVDRALLEKVCLPLLKADGMMNLDSMREIIAWMAAEKFIDRPLKAEEWWDPSFLEAARGK